MTSRASVSVAFAVAALGIAFFSAMDAVMKALVIAIGAYDAMFWRVLVLIALAGLVYYARRPKRPTKAAMRLHATRGTLSAFMGLLFFWGLGRVPLAQGVALSFVAPLIALYLAALVLKERIERQAIFASLLGFAGVVVILSGQAQAEMGPEAFWGAIAILASAGLYAWNIILMRQQALAAGPFEIAFFNSLFMGAMLALAAPFLAEVPPAGEAPNLILAAGLAYASLLMLSWAYARAEAQHLAPVEYTAFIWAALLGFVFFHEPVRLLTLLGASMIVAGCLLAASRRRPSPIADVEAAI